MKILEYLLYKTNGDDIKLSFFIFIMLKGGELAFTKVINPEEKDYNTFYYLNDKQ